jgi:hypothetical protein
LKKLSIYISLLFVLTCAKEDSQAPNLPPTQIAKQYTLTASAGDGGSVTGGGTFASGTKVSLIATPSSGYSFSEWSNGSTTNPLTVTLNSNTSITANFEVISVSASVDLPTKSKLFTVNNSDTLKIPINVPNGFKNISLVAEDGNIIIESKPEIGSQSGDVIISYNTNIINNVDWDRTIAGKDNILIQIEDQLNNTISIDYSFRVQPEPIYRNYNFPHGKFTDGNESRARVNLELIEHLNRRASIYYAEYCSSGETEPYEIFNGDSESQMEDGKIYLGANFLERYPGSTYGQTLYPDLNGDGYEDLVFTRISNYGGNCFGCEALPLEFYLYEDGEYKYHEFTFSGLNEINVKMGFWVILADFDNDMDPDILVQGSPDAGGYGEGISDKVIILENRVNSSNDFVIHEFQPRQLSDKNAPVDMNLDGLLDIVSGPGPNVYINKGNFQFDNSFDSYRNNINYFDIDNPEFNSEYFNGQLLYFDLNSSSIFDDFDNDGITDVYIPGIEGEYQLFFENGEFPYVPEVPSGKIIFGEIEERYIEELGGNKEILRFKYQNIVGIPEVPGFEELYSAKFKDIDNDGKKELVIERLHLNVSYTEDSSGQRTYNNRQEGHYIQILEINNREFTDVTNEYIDDNFGTDSGVIFGECNFDNRLPSHIRVDDTDSDGFMEIFSLKTKLLPFDKKDHIWEWNGSKFIKANE